MIIETERLILRPFTLDDAERLAEICQNETIHRFTASLPYPYKLEHAISWITKQQNGSDECPFAAILKENNELIGNISVRIDLRNNKGELGYFFDEPYWNNGYASEAAGAVIGYAFEELNLNKVYARHKTDNPASGRVMEKNGMKFEGVLRQELLKNGKYYDVAVRSILREEYYVKV